MLVLEMYLIKGEDTFVVFFESQGKVVRLNEVFGGNIRSSKLHFSESPPMYFCIILSLKENNGQETVTKPSSYSFQRVRERRKKKRRSFFFVGAFYWSKNATPSFLPLPIILLFYVSCCWLPRRSYGPEIKCRSFPVLNCARKRFFDTNIFGTKVFA